MKDTHPFPKLYRCRDAVSNEHCLCKDDSSGQRVLNVTLSGHLNTEPNQAAWAVFAERALNNHAALVAALESALLELEANKVAMVGPEWAAQRTATGGALLQVVRALNAAKP